MDASCPAGTMHHDWGEEPKRTARTAQEDPIDAEPLPPFGLIFVVVIAVILVLAVYARR
jgi:hypothetical protein